MSIASERMTLDEFLAKYEHDPVLEYAQGVVSEKMSPGWNHSAIQSIVAHRLNVLLHGPKLGFAFTELRVTDEVADESRIPDISVYVWRRIERNPARQQRGAFEPPDIAIEIMSPGQSRHEQLDRCRGFVANGAHAALLFEPPTQTVTEVRPDAPERVYRGADIIDLGDVVPGLRLAVGDLFAELSFE